MVGAQAQRWQADPLARFANAHRAIHARPSQLAPALYLRTRLQVRDNQPGSFPSTHKVKPPRPVTEKLAGAVFVNGNNI